ncbi:hypothetical protein Salat_1235900 [Sesamum alatum]|uniref:Uncharacterized protein n=1 Tax=Sesamum alatum TaxID=300844 RepID=A0AAE1YFJ7_9LAMI|nr:hypothetical protein Salat_1235900 [Sesamum alatum]
MLGTSGISCWRNSLSSLYSISIRRSSTESSGRGGAGDGARLLPIDPASAEGPAWLALFGLFSLARHIRRFDLPDIRDLAYLILSVATTLHTFGGSVSHLFHRAFSFSLVPSDGALTRGPASTTRIKV